MTDNDLLWKTKLAARLHDPAEKALVLYRDPSGHEGGSIVAVGKELGFDVHRIKRRDGTEIEKLKLSVEMERVVERADHWAAAADRAQFPKDENERYVSWAQVRFTEEGEIINPLSPGQRYRIEKIGHQVLAEHIKKASEDLFEFLIQRRDDGKPDYRLTTLAFWRFGPELGRELKGIGHLWSLLPADTRTSDHTIWQHLDLTSALAGAMADGGKPALLFVSIGPVQDFIAAGRSTTDLWAGSHFLSTLAWQAMQVVAERYGPDAILFPQLRGVPAVDLWLIEQGLDAGLFRRFEPQWHDTQTDYNPLFVAALPNRFVALVPESEGCAIVKEIRKRLRSWVLEEARAMLDRVLEEIGEPRQEDKPCYRQLKEQLRDFPELHWSLVPWSSAGELEAALKPFYPEDDKWPSLFESEAWKTLTAPIDPQQGWRFWEPNEGVLYAAVYDLVDRTLAAAKSTRPFTQLEQKGYRDSLSGEHEWLTLDEKQLTEGSPRRRDDTLWARVSKERPSWAKKGEHLSAFGLIKRLWPERFIETLKTGRWYQQLDDKPDLSRYVVSTHVMALAPSLERLMREGPQGKEEDTLKAYEKLVSKVANLKRPALPRRLMKAELRQNRQWWETATKLPAYLERTEEEAKQEETAEHVETRLCEVEKAIGMKVERYYSLLLMDGDRLGAWLSGQNTLKFEDTFHTKVKKGLSSYDSDTLKRYLNMERPVSPARHMAISTALNGFALDLVRHVVEDVCLGKLLYAGGDDVMAMVAVRDLPKVMGLLREVYSGGMPEGQEMPFDAPELELKRGFVMWRNRLYLAMGERATASCGAVVAHHQAPLAAVLRELRAAEKRAKGAGRNRFSITVIKRSGGALDLTAEWGEPLTLLWEVRNFLAAEDTSRRAVYHVQEWLADLPEPKQDSEMLETLLSYQLGRQARSQKDKAPALAQRLARLAIALNGDAREWLRNFLAVAEFLARETRTLTDQDAASAETIREKTA